MFIKFTRSGPRQYVQLVEAYRDESGKAKQRTLAILGRVEDLQDSVDSVIAVCSRLPVAIPACSPGRECRTPEHPPEK